jgi:hypothetical protein
MISGPKELDSANAPLEEAKAELHQHAMLPQMRDRPTTRPMTAP